MRLVSPSCQWTFTACLLPVRPTRRRPLLSQARAAAAPPCPLRQRGDSVRSLLAAAALSDFFFPGSLIGGLSCWSLIAASPALSGSETVHRPQLPRNSPLSLHTARCAPSLRFADSVSDCPGPLARENGAGPPERVVRATLGRSVDLVSGRPVPWAPAGVARSPAGPPALASGTGCGSGPAASRWTARCTAWRSLALPARTGNFRRSSCAASSPAGPARPGCSRAACAHPSGSAAPTPGAGAVAAPDCVPADASCVPAAAQSTLLWASQPAMLHAQRLRRLAAARLGRQLHRLPRLGRLPAREAPARERGGLQLLNVPVQGGRPSWTAAAARPATLCRPLPLGSSGAPDLVEGRSPACRIDCHPDCRRFQVNATARRAPGRMSDDSPRRREDVLTADGPQVKATRSECSCRNAFLACRRC